MIQRKKLFAIKYFQKNVVFDKGVGHAQTELIFTVNKFRAVMTPGRLRDRTEYVSEGILFINTFSLLLIVSKKVREIEL